MDHFLSRLCWPLLKVQFAGHAHVKLVLDVGMWVTGYELSTRRDGSPIRSGPKLGPLLFVCLQNFSLGRPEGDSTIKYFISTCETAWLKNRGLVHTRANHGAAENKDTVCRECGRRGLRLGGNSATGI